MNRLQEILTLGGVAFFGLGTGFLASETQTRIQDEPAEKGFRSEARKSQEHSSSPKTFRELIVDSRNRDAIPEDVRNAIVKVESGVLKQMMIGLAAALNEKPGSDEEERIKDLLKIAGRELYRRDGAGAVEWAMASGSKEIEVTMIIIISEENPMEAKPYHERYDAKYNEIHGQSFGGDAVVAAAMRNADDLLVVEKEYYNFGVRRFAEDFDFRRYVSGSGSEMNIDAAFEVWVVRDPEAAAKALREGLGIAGSLIDKRFASAFVGRAAAVGEVEAAKWIARQLATLPEDQRIQNAGRLAYSYPTNTRARAVLEHLSSEDEKVEFARYVLRGMNSSNKEWICSNMEEPARIRIVEKWLEFHLLFGEKEELFNQLEVFGSDLKLPQAESERLRKLIEQKE